jgi:hypothetical protein
MTKKEMIKTVQKFEAQAFLQLKQDESLWGADDRYTSRSRARWVGINALMDELGIKSDITLPENQEAIILITARVNQEEEY